MGSFRKWSQDGQAVSVKAPSPLLSESFPGMSWDLTESQTCRTHLNSVLGCTGGKTATQQATAGVCRTSGGKASWQRWKMRHRAGTDEH